MFKHWIRLLDLDNFPVGEENLAKIRRDVYSYRRTVGAVALRAEFPCVCRNPLSLEAIQIVGGDQSSFRRSISRSSRAQEISAGKRSCQLKLSIMQAVIRLQRVDDDMSCEFLEWREELELFESAVCRQGW